MGGKMFSCNVYDTINKALCPEDSFLFNGVYLKTAGTYYDTFTISLGCDTFRTLYLTVHPTIALTRIADSFCPDYTYTFNAKTLTISGTFYDTLNSTNGCDSVIELSLSYKYRPIVVYPKIDSFCIRDTVYFQGKKYKYTFGGNKTIRDTMFGAAMNGCDSINIMAVYVRNNEGPSFPITTKYGCSNVPFVIGDSTFTTNGFKTVVLRNRFGCDSTVWFTLQRRPMSIVTLNRTTCANQPYLFNSKFYTASSVNDTLVIDSVWLTQTANAPGFGTQKCDSLVILRLTVYPVRQTIIDTLLCENHFYFFKGQNRNTSGTYLDTLKTVNNCDSFITLNLSIRKTSRYTYYRKFCSNQTVYFHQTNIDQPGTYKDTLVNAMGCDSFLTMVLTKDTAHNIIVNESICSYDSFYFNGKYLDTAGTYMATFKNKYGCDSMVTLNLSIYPFRTVTLVRSTLNNIKTDSGYKAYYWFYNEWTQLNVTGHILAANTTGSYHVIAQDENNCRFKSNVYVYNPAGVNRNLNLGIQIYPNPTSNAIFIESSNTFDKNTYIKIYSLDGKLIMSQPSHSKATKLIIDVSNLVKGIYILKLESENMTIERRIEKL